MSNLNTITFTHVKKLGHSIHEIRSRALDNIVSKFDLGFGCDCDAVKRELIIKLFNWFSFENIPRIEEALDLLHRLVKIDNSVYLSAFGKLKFQNELQQLRRRLNAQWHDKINKIEETVLRLDKYQEICTCIHGAKDPCVTCKHSHEYDHLMPRYNKYDVADYSKNAVDVSSDRTAPSPLDSTLPFELTLQCPNGTPISKTTEGGIKWLIMPWQPLVTSDKGVLTAVEDALNNTLDTNLILHTCQFITNVMLQDFPAEVFLQRPTIVLILHSLLESSGNTLETYITSVVPAVLKTLHKLTRSLRFRIYYYCDPCVANKKQKSLAEKLDSNVYPSSNDRNSPDGSIPEANYQAYQSAATSERSQSFTDNIDDSVLQLQQMLIPTYCIESLKRTISQLNIPVNSNCPIKNTKYVTDLSYELVQLLTLSIMPNIWLCNDNMAKKMTEDLKTLLTSLGEAMEYFSKYSSVDHLRITYLHLVSISVKLLSSILPFELTEVVLPVIFKRSLCDTVMDAPIYLLYPKLHSTIQEYIRQFQSTNELDIIKLFDETRAIIKSMQAAICLIKNSSDQSPSNTLRTIYASNFSLSYHKNTSVIKKAIKFLEGINRYDLHNDDLVIYKKLILSLLANEDTDIQHTTYKECHALVKSVLGVQYSKEKLSWESLVFLLEPSILTEIISHGTTNEDDKIKEISEEILIYILKGKMQIEEAGWLKILEAIVPVFSLLQCFANSLTALGRCITKMLHPDIFENIQLPYLEVLKGNLRLLFSPNCDIREEALCRLIWLLNNEKDSNKKLPRLSSLHNLPLSSLCIFERQHILKLVSEGNYQRSGLLSVLEMLNESDIDPKMRKSALVQISVMLSDISLHKLFINENGLSLILNIFNNALIENNYMYYPDSVISILTILKLITFTTCAMRHELSTRADVFSNIIRSIFLFPNNECVKMNGSQLLCFLLYNDYIMRINDQKLDSNQLNISLPYIIVSRMKLPFACKSHWKTSIHRRSNVSVLHASNQTALTFVRQYWAWEWHGGIQMLWKNCDELNDIEVSRKLMIQEFELLCLRYSCPYYYCQQQLYNVQNSTTHNGVLNALDYLIMCLKLYKMLQYEETKDICSLDWKQTFERFLLSYPINKEDSDLFVNVINFLQLYVNITKDGESLWVSKIMKNMTKSLAGLFHNLDIDNQDVHQSILKLARTCSAIEKSKQSYDHSKDTWIRFIELVVSTLCFGNQQHFYNLAYLDWLLTCMTYLIGQCEWGDHKNLLMSLGNTLIEMIISFHGAGTVSFMGLSITRNSIICLNHLLHQMRMNFNKNSWIAFWYEDGRSLSWLPMLWQNRDPLVRASALQLLAGLLNELNTTSHLLNAIVVAPSELCHTLLEYIINREESCIVKEQACIAFNNLLRNYNSISLQHVESLKINTILMYIEQTNIYYEISILCSKVYMLASLDSDQANRQNKNEKALSLQNITSGCIPLVPRTISYLYNCHDELQPFSARNSDSTDVDNCLQSIATPSLITATCALLNSLILIRQQEVIHQIYEHSIDKYLIGCFNDFPKNIENIQDLTHYYDTLEMYINICITLSNCVIYSNEFAAIATFSADSIYTMFNFLNVTSYHFDTPRAVYLGNRLKTEIYNFLAVLSLTDGQSLESIQTAIELCTPDIVLNSICTAIKYPSMELRMSAISCLAFLLTHEIQKEPSRKSNDSLRTVLDSAIAHDPTENKNNSLQDVISSINRLSIKNANLHSKKPSEHAEDEADTIDSHACVLSQKRCMISAELCKVLLHLFITHNYNKSKKNRKYAENKDLIISAFANLLCVSNEAKKVAMKENLSETVLMILKELYVKLNLQPFELYKNQVEREKKVHPLLNDINNIFILLMNFMYGNLEVKETLTKDGLADVLHKLWVWIALSKDVSTSALKMLATFTTKCPSAAQSLTLTTVLPGTGLRKTPNTVALLHVIIQLASKEIEKAGQSFDNHKLHFAFHILRNAVHVHECRVSIAKSNLLHFFTKIHPLTTKRVKPWPLIEVYCLEFLIDFTFYEEGQLSVPKAVDSLDALLNFAKCSSSSTRILAISILRNLAFNLTNRPRLLSSVEFINLLHDILKNGSLNEVRVTASMIWSLICNSQKGKLIARSAGLSQSIQETLGRLTLLTTDRVNQEQDLIRILQYVLNILSPIESKNGSVQFTI